MISDDDPAVLPTIHVKRCTDGTGYRYSDLPFLSMDEAAIRTALVLHQQTRPRVRKIEKLREIAQAHRCTPACEATLFELLHSWPVNTSVTKQEVKSHLAKVMRKSVESQFPPSVSADRKTEIIREWCDHMTTARYAEHVCAVCSELLPEHRLTTTMLQPYLHLLQNSNLPENLVQALNPNHQGAIFDSEGITSGTGEPLAGTVCVSCLASLKGGGVPAMSLANGLYLGHDKLPPDIRHLFRIATPIEISIISRARVRCTIYKFSQKKAANTDHNELPISDVTSQKYSKGHVITFANGNADLLNVLPPSPEQLTDTMAVIFWGAVLPSPEEIKRHSPLLVRRQVVVRLLEWLKANNPYYQEVQISQENLDALMPEEECVPPCLQMHLVQSTEVDEGHMPLDLSQKSSTEIPMASHGVIGTTIDGLSIKQIKLLAIRHWKAGGTAYAIPHGQKPLQDYDNPGLWTGMFPHLFPWGIGLPEDPERTRKVTIEAHVKHLLNFNGRRFQVDHSFSFVAMNILQRRRVRTACQFKVKRSEWDNALELLCSAELSVCDRIRARGEANPHSPLKPKNEAEKRLFDLMDKVTLAATTVPGSQGSKLKLRNQIRAMCTMLGMPTIFFTLNPADIYNPLFCLLAGVDVKLEDKVSPNLPDTFERSIMLAKNPVAGAKFFDAMMTSFIDVVLGYGKKKEVGAADESGLPAQEVISGVFGPVEAYYGTIETQGRGSLHCHMFIWIRGGLGPQKLREQMKADAQFKSDLFTYLEDIIHTSLPGQTDICTGEDAKWVPRPEGAPHPCTLRCPHPDEPDFQTEFDAQLYQTIMGCHFHRHSSTCWKKLKPNEPRDDDHCRMRINGHTRLETAQDDDTGSILHKRLHPFLNQYNSLVSMLTKCNSDVKFIGSGEGAKALIYYATEYITKNNLPTYVAFAALQRVMDSVNPDQLMKDGGHAAGRTVLVKACNAIMAEQELAAHEVAAHLLGLAQNNGDHYASHQFCHLYWTSFLKWASLEEARLGWTAATMAEDTEDQLLPDTAAVFSADPLALPAEPDLQPEADSSVVMADSDLPEPEDVLMNLDPKQPDVLPKSQVDDYKFRGDALSDMSLYWFAATTSKITASSERYRLGKKKAGKTDGKSIGRPENPRVPFDTDHPQSDQFLLMLASTVSIPIIHGPPLPRGDYENQKELYARAMLLLFKPWKQLADLKMQQETWTDAFDAYPFDSGSLNVMQNMAAMFECKDATDAYRVMRANDKVTQEENWIDHHLLRAHTSDGDQARATLLEATDFANLMAEFPGLSGVLDAPERIDGAKLGADAAGQAIEQAIRNGAFVSPPRDESELEDRALLSNPAIRKETAKHNKAFGDGKKAAKKRQRQEQYEEVEEFEDELPVPVPPLHKGKRRQSARVTQVQASEHTIAKHKSYEDIMSDFTLNIGQRRAFGVVAMHHANRDILLDQLLMYVGGAGGTGKSRIIHALKAYFAARGESHRIKFVAPTGTAAFLIGGQTIHDLCRINLARDSGAVSADMQSEFESVDYLVVDEVSMVGSRLMSGLSSKLGAAKRCDLPFGGINVIFFGDIAQLPPVGDNVLWNENLISKSVLPKTMGASPATNAKAQLKSHGKGLWASVNKVVMLTENHRQKQDPAFAGIVGRISRGEGTLNDQMALNQRLMSNVGVPASFAEAPLITSDKRIRDKWNREAVRTLAARSSQSFHEYASVDTIEGCNTDGQLKQSLRSLRSSRSGTFLGRLPLVQGAKVMILRNLMTQGGVTNGAEGTIDSIVYHEEEDGTRVAEVAYVRINDCSFSFSPSLEPGVVPVLPVSDQFHAITTRGKKYAVTRHQLPLVPCYSYTDYKSQGKTIQNVIIDLATCSSRESAYVLCSRAVTLQNLLILRPFHISVIQRRLSLNFKREFARLEELDQVTAQEFDCVMTEAIQAKQ